MAGTTLTGWHGTNAEFESFGEEHFGSVRDRSPNGALGVWLYTVPGLAEGAGDVVLEVQAEPRNVIDMTVGQMMREHNAAEFDDDPVTWFVRRRAELRALGHDAIRMVESDGSSLISVILDVDRITSVTRLSPTPFPKGVTCVSCPCGP